MNETSLFITLVNDPVEINPVRLLIDSIRTFGGPMGGCPIWLFVSDLSLCNLNDWAFLRVDVHPLKALLPDLKYPFKNKVAACAQAESQLPPEIRSLIWLDPECLVVQPPVLFDLDDYFDTAVRPVHHRNIGALTSEPLDPFWKGILDELGLPKLEFAVESFLDSQTLHAYFNSHGFAVNPRLGILQRWQDHFEHLITNQDFQDTACPDERHRIFLFQALLSTLLASSVDQDRIRILPPVYNYPYNLYRQIIKPNKVGSLNELVCFTYEDRTIQPAAVNDIDIHEPLRSWLANKTALPHD